MSSDRPGSSGGTVLLITDQRRPDHFEVRWGSRWAGFLTRLRAAGLDRRLAAGGSPESNRLLAIRAQQLVAPAMRRTLAQSWATVLDAARQPAEPSIRRVPLCRDRIIAAESELREMIACLLAPLPVPVRGVAMVTSLLRDGTGPLYNRNSVLGLSSLFRRAIAELDPSIELDRPA